MEPQRRRRRRLATAVSSLLSQTLLFLLLHPSTLPPSPPYPPSTLLLLLHLLSLSTFPLSLPLKRKHHSQNSHSRPNPHLNPDHFPLSFNMTASSFEWLAGLLDPLLDSPSLSSRTRLAVSLSRLASGEPYSSLSARFGISENTARLCCKRLCRVLLTNFRFWLSFPSSPSDLTSISSSFRSESNGAVPNCCGAITCTRFKARNGAVGVQIVADCSYRILNAAAGFRGSRSDFEILRASSLYKDLGEGGLLSDEQYLFGKGSYPLLPCLMVPFEKEKADSFNQLHRLMCQPVRRVVASLRNWGVLSSLEEETDGKMVAACIGSCAMLHNALLMRKDYSVLSEGEMEMEIEVGFGRDEDLESFEAEGKAVMRRNELADRARAIRQSVGSRDM